MLEAPLEQFQIVSLFSIKFCWVNWAITNFLIINLIALIIMIASISYNSSTQNCLHEVSIFFIPNNWQKFMESTSELPAKLISDLIVTNNEKYFPVVSVAFNFILFSNLIGLIPYSFTTTSHLFVTFTLSFSVFIGVNIMTLKKYGRKTFSLFLPVNTTFFLALVLVPLEFVSHLTKPISLGVRLFVNLMAGHTLLKVIIGFGWSMLLLENEVSFGMLVPLVTLVGLFGLELGVALIQTYVFITLTCIYIQDGS